MSIPHDGGVTPFALTVGLTFPESALSGVSVGSLRNVEVVAYSESLQRRFVAARFEPLKVFDWEVLAYVTGGGGGGAAAAAAGGNGKAPAAFLPDYGGIYIHQVTATRAAGDNAATLVVGTMSSGVFFRPRRALASSLNCEPPPSFLAAPLSLSCHVAAPIARLNDR